MEAEVNFAPNEKPLGMTDKSKDELETEGEVHQLTHRRNVAFLHLYVLAMYNKNLLLVPKEVNTFMEFEYGLIRRTYDIIKKVCEDFEINNQQGKPRWLEYKKTPQYAELKTLLAKDYYLAKAYPRLNPACTAPADCKSSPASPTRPFRRKPRSTCRSSTTTSRRCSRRRWTSTSSTC